MRKGIKKWQSKLAKLNQIQKRNISIIKHCDKLNHDNQILKEFIIDIYQTTINQSRLTIQQKDFKLFRFLEDARITNLYLSHDQTPLQIQKPHEIAIEKQQQRKLNDHFNFNCGHKSPW